MARSKVRVVMNRENFGKDVMAGPAISARIQSIAEGVAAQVSGDVSVRMVTMRVRGGGSRVRAHVANGSHDSQEAKTNDLTRALHNTVRSK